MQYQIVEHLSVQHWKNATPNSTILQWYNIK